MCYLIKLKLSISIKHLVKINVEPKILTHGKSLQGFHHPTPPEIYLIIEVADSSLKLDTEIKAKAYSQAGIKDYWVLDVVKRELIVFRKPTTEGYQNQAIITEHQIISPLDFSDLEIVVAEMLPIV